MNEYGINNEEMGNFCFDLSSFPHRRHVDDSEFNELVNKCKGSVWYHKEDIFFPIFSLFNYYPKSKWNEITNLDDKDRNLVNNILVFKYSYDYMNKEYHDKMLPEFVKVVCHSLKNIFGTSDLEKMMLVSVYAAEQKVYERRIKEFSRQVCENLHMEDGYNCITYIKDGISKHTDREHAKEPELLYNRDLLKDKLVVLFDDIITGGNTMLRVRDKLEECGARVICGISLGKTVYVKGKHPIVLFQEEKERSENREH